MDKAIVWYDFDDIINERNAIGIRVRNILLEYLEDSNVTGKNFENVKQTIIDAFNETIFFYGNSSQDQLLKDINASNNFSTLIECIYVHDNYIYYYQMPLFINNIAKRVIKDDNKVTLDLYKSYFNSEVDLNEFERFYERVSAKNGHIRMWYKFDNMYGKFRNQNIDWLKTTIANYTKKVLVNYLQKQSIYESTTQQFRNIYKRDTLQQFKEKIVMYIKCINNYINLYTKSNCELIIHGIDNIMTFTDMLYYVLDSNDIEFFFWMYRFIYTVHNIRPCSELQEGYTDRIIIGDMYKYVVLKDSKFFWDCWCIESLEY